MSTKVLLLKAMVCPVVMYGCESWTIKKSECWRIYAFELWCWRLLRVRWTARRSNQSILKETSPGCSLEVLILKLKLQYFGHLMQRADSFEKTLMLGKIKGRRWREWQRMRWLDGITDSIDMGLGELQELVMDRKAWHGSWGHKEPDMTEQLEWTELRQWQLHVVTSQTWFLITYLREKTEVLFAGERALSLQANPESQKLEDHQQSISSKPAWEVPYDVSDLTQWYLSSSIVSHWLFNTYTQKKCSHWQYRCLWKKASVFKTKRY